MRPVRQSGGLRETYARPDQSRRCGSAFGALIAEQMEAWGQIVRHIGWVLD